MTKYSDALRPFTKREEVLPVVTRGMMEPSAMRLFSLVPWSLG